MSTLTEELRKGRKNIDYSDVIVIVGGKDFPCHRVILASRSQLFDKMLQTDTKETKQRRVEVKGISAETFEVLLRFIYEDKDILAKDNFFDILLAANQLQMQSLLVKGKQFMTKILCLENCGRVYMISHIRQWNELRKSAWKLLEQNFDELEPEEFGVLSNEDMKLLVSSDQLKTRTEDFVLGKVLQWVGLVDPDHDGKEGKGRVKYLPELLKTCKYFLISPNFLWDILNKNRFIQAGPQCRELVQEIARHKTQLDTHQHGCLSGELHRVTDLVQDVRVDMFTTNLNVFEVDDFKGNSKKLSLPFPTKPSRFTGGAYFNGTSYFEVSDDEKKVKAIYEYDPIQEKVTCLNEWENPQGDDTAGFLPVGNALVALRVSGTKRANYFIESIQFPCKPSYRWVSVGCPTMKGKDVECVTSIGSKLLIFWKNANPESLSIECYDLDHRKSYILDDTLSLSTNVKAFKKGDQVFALQGDGMLWRVQALEDPPYVKLVQEKQLWTGQEKLQGVMLVLDRLVVYRKEPKPHAPMQWCHNINIDGLFTAKCSIAVTGKIVNIFHAVLDKKVLPISE